MKKIIILILSSLILSLNFITVFAENEQITDEVTPNGPSISAESAILIDEKTGMILYEKNAHRKLYPASITKIMTVYLATKNLDDNQVVKASKNAIFGFDRASSHLWLSPDEEFKAKDLEYASLLASANDASNILAEAVSGSLEEFVNLMNQTVSDLNLVETHFNNVHGLPDSNHYTSAYDMAMITRHALKNKKFKEVYSTSSYKMEKTNKSEEERQLATGNKMLKNSEFKYEYATGGKTGWTKEAGYTMVTSASKDNMDLIAVVLNEADADSRYVDTKALFEYGFNNYKTIVIKGSEIPSKVVEIKKGKKVIAKATFSINLDFNILLPFQKDESAVTTDIKVRNEDSIEGVQAYLSISIDGKEVGEQIMDKSVETFESNLSNGVESIDKSNKIFDYISLLVLGIFLFRSFILLTLKIKAPE